MLTTTIKRYYHKFHTKKYHYMEFYLERLHYGYSIAFDVNLGEKHFSTEVTIIVIIIGIVINWKS